MSRTTRVAPQTSAISSARRRGSRASLGLRARRSPGLSDLLVGQRKASETIQEVSGSVLSLLWVVLLGHAYPRAEEAGTFFVTLAPSIRRIRMLARSTM